MTLDQERKQIASYSRRLRPDGLVVLTFGNISVRSGDLLAITPTGVDYDALDAQAVTVIDMKGGVVEGDLGPSSEWPLHAAIYGSTDCGAIVHTHSPYGTALSTVVDEIPPLHYVAASLGGSVRVSPYCPPGSTALADRCAQGLQDRYGLLMANHGAVAVGKTLAQAYERAIALEWLCTLYYRARLLGTPRILTREEMAEVSELMADYGRPRKAK